MSAKFNQRIFLFYLVVCYLLFHHFLKGIPFIVILLTSFFAAGLLLIGIDAIILRIKGKTDKEENEEEA